jgi:hypothetical protein
MRHVELLAVAKQFGELREERRTRLVERYVADTRQKFSALPKINGHPLEMDETLVRERGHQLVSDDQEQQDLGREMRVTY